MVRGVEADQIERRVVVLNSCFDCDEGGGPELRVDALEVADSIAADNGDSFIVIGGRLGHWRISNGWQQICQPRFLHEHDIDIERVNAVDE